LLREDFQSTGVGSLVTVGVRDIQGEGFPDEYSGLADSVFLDLPQPWLAILSAGKMLKQDGTLCSFSPCIEQVQRTCEALKSNFRGKSIVLLSEPLWLCTYKKSLASNKMEPFFI